MMEKTTISTKKHILKFGSIFGILWILYGIIRYLTNNMTTWNWKLSVIEFTILVSVIIYGIYSYKTANSGYLKLVEALKIGTGIIIVGTSIQIFWDIFFLKAVAPEVMDQLINLSKNQISNQGLDQDSVLIRKNKFLFTTSLIALIGNLTLGIVVSLLSGAIMQKNRDPFN